jgi:hypothetical protein
MTASNVVPWYENYEEVLAFARILADADILDTVAETIYYFEKPNKWSTDHAAWNEFGRPEDGDEDWDLFLDRIA